MGRTAHPKPTVKESFSRNFRGADQPPIDVLPYCGKSRQALETATAPPFAQWHRRCKSGDAHASDPAVGGIARVRIRGSILSCGKILAQRWYPIFDMAWLSIRSRSFSQRSREISAAGPGRNAGAD